MSEMRPTADELEEVEAVLSKMAEANPPVVLMALISELISVACGTNPALKDVMRLQFYRRVYERLVTRLR